MADAVGILGGTFDPFHYGHLRLAIECHEKLNLKNLRLVPLYKPPHRDAPVATAEQRLAMLSLAVRDHGFLQIDDCELQRRGVSYTVDTVKHLRDKAGKIPLCLLMGRDAFNNLTGWRDWQNLIGYAHIVVVDRPGNSLASNEASLAEFIHQHRTNKLDELHAQPASKLFELEIPLLDISATQIRSTIHSGNDPSGLLPEAVMEYIYTHSLYQQEHS